MRVAKKRNADRKLQWLASIGGGMLLAASCSQAEIQAVVAGLDAAATVLTHEEEDDKVSFVDWLHSEFDDD